MQPNMLHKVNQIEDQLKQIQHIQEIQHVQQMQHIKNMQYIKQLEGLHQPSIPKTHNNYQLLQSETTDSNSAANQTAQFLSNLSTVHQQPHVSYQYPLQIPQQINNNRSHYAQPTLPPRVPPPLPTSLPPQHPPQVMKSGYSNIMYNRRRSRNRSGDRQLNQSAYSRRYRSRSRDRDRDRDRYRSRSRSRSRDRNPRKYSNHDHYSNLNQSRSNRFDRDDHDKQFQNGHKMRFNRSSHNNSSTSEQMQQYTHKPQGFYIDRHPYPQINNYKQHNHMIHQTPCVMALNGKCRRSQRGCDFIHSPLHGGDPAKWNPLWDDINWKQNYLKKMNHVLKKHTKS